MAIAAQMLDGRARPHSGRVDRRHLRRVIDRIGLLQIDSVNVVCRSQYLPLLARIGPYRPDALDAAAYGHRDYFETWAHEASLLPVGLHPLLRWRMRPEAMHHRYQRWADVNEKLIEKVYATVEEKGPTAAGDVADGEKRTGPWWDWTSAKTALEWLFATGKVAVATRRNFERLYDVTERVIPTEVLDRPTPTETEARRNLLLIAARAMGVATASDLADYFRMKVTVAKPLIRDLVEAGDLVPIRVEGWKDQAWLHADARIPRDVDACALLSPFDSLVWDRRRTERLFGFHYRIEIYTPAAKRRYGYYVLPFLCGDRLVARVDAKADRAASVLRLPSIHYEEGVDSGAAASRLDAALGELADWLELERVETGSVYVNETGPAPPQEAGVDGRVKDRG